MLRKYFEPKYTRFWLFAVLLLAFLFRYIGLTTYPKGFNADEASFGYDAYSILLTGRDQWGTQFPLVLKSFGDFKSPLYSYIAVPFVALLGLNEFAVRLPSVIVGVLAVYVTYLLTVQILPKNRSHFAIVSAFLLAVSPWHIMLSRAAIEANLTILLLPAGILFFIKGIKNPKLFFYSAIFFGLNLFAYHTGKLLTLMVVIGLTIFYWKTLKNIGLRKTFFAGATFAVFLFAMLYTFSLGGGSRISERSIFQGALLEGAEKRIIRVQQGSNPVVAKILHNKYQVAAQRFINNYKQYFSLRFLNQGAGESYYAMVPGIGILYTFELIMILGLLFLFKQKGIRKIVLVLLIWLTISPLPAALSTGVGYSGTRASGMLPVLPILSAFGLIGWLSVLNNKIVFTRIIIFCLFITSVIQISNFRIRYINTKSSMLYGNVQVSKWLKDNRGTKNVIVSRSLSEPQIFIAFVNNWNPKEYKKEAQGWDLDKHGVMWVDQLPEWRLGPYTFKSIDWNRDSAFQDTLVVAKPDELPQDISPIYEIKYEDGTPAILVVDTLQKLYAQSR